MFGFVLANLDLLSEEDKKRYRAYYCGLCQALKARHGTLCRLTLNYDLTFLVLFLDAVYNVEDDVRRGRCPVHPFAQNGYFAGEFTDYAADMNTALVYYKKRDDWNDDHSAAARAEAAYLARKMPAIEQAYPKKCRVIRQCLDALGAMEKDNVLNPDLPAACFGILMGELFSLREDERAADLRAFGSALGKLIYIMDACVDLKKDLKKQRYNPMVRHAQSEFDDMINLLMYDVIAAYRKLGVQKEKALIENILFSGILFKYEFCKKRSEKGK